MIGRRRTKSLLLLAVLPLFGLIFWLSAVVASHIPNVLVIAVDVHGLNLPSLAGDSGAPRAPLSLQVLSDALHDSGTGGTSQTSVTTTPTPTPSRPAGSRPTPAPSPSATPVPLPLPTPTGILPTPTPTPSPATISGQVTDSQTKLPIVGATVTVNPSGKTAVTNANGDFTIGVSAGTYTVTASAATYNSASQSVSVAQGQNANIVFKLVSITAYGSLSGTVTNSVSGAPVAAATVTLSNGLIRTTDLNGNFSYTIVLTGTYTLTVSAVGYVSQSQLVSIKAGHTTNVQISLVHS